MLTKQTSRLHGSSSLFLLVTAACLAIAQAAPCDRCLYGASYCHPNTHNCLYGCEPGWKGDDCTLQCDNKSCKECMISKSSIEQCTRCYEDFYGPLCNLKCNDNCKRYSGSSICDRFGNCHFGCVKPYTGPRCEDQNCPFENCQSCSVSRYYERVYCYICSAGYYWSDQMWRCVQCTSNCLYGPQDCDTNTGICRSGKCSMGWFGDRCDRYCSITNCSRCAVSQGEVICLECQSGQFPGNDGKKCISCATQHCNGLCDPVHGQCKNGCLPGYYGDGFKCDQVCTVSNCEQCILVHNGLTRCARCKKGYHVNRHYSCVMCPSTCKNGSCDVYSGHCSNGCVSGYYGEQCQYKCGDHCTGNVCDEDNGSCVCIDGWYGQLCNRACPEHCLDCDTFKDGKCEGCESGFYGTICNQSCNSNCHKYSLNNYKYLYCDQQTGHCAHGCYDGFHGPACELECSKNCFSNLCEQQTGKCSEGCALDWYGEQCDKKCPHSCHDATVGYQRTCDRTSGSCQHGCKPGYYGDYCNYTCSSQCEGHICDSNGKCRDGCIYGFTGANCDLVCTNNCPSVCSPNCIAESCDTRTKTCEKGCNSGWYGPTCQEICSSTCFNRKCDQDTGACQGACQQGFFGADCSQRCNAQCKGNTCSKNYGYCTLGCHRNYHGPDCSLKCSHLCENGTCEQNSGHCTTCGIGRQGSFCEQDCLPGYYGENCGEQCGHCKDYSPCYMSDGRCPSGCEAGWTGPTCSQALYSSEQETAVSISMQIAIGCSVGGAFCALIILGIFCWLRKKKTMKNQKSEPVVVYSDTQVQIQGTVSQPTTTVQLVHSQDETSSNDSDASIQSQSAMLLGDADTGSQIRVLQMLCDGEFYKLHKGMVTMQSQREECCVKVVTLSDDEDKTEHIKRLKRETDILTVCGCHINVVNMIKTYQNTDVYCVVLNKCMQTGLRAYLQGLESSCTAENIDPVHLFQLLQICIDCCSAVIHLHNQKVLHHALQAGHVYLTDALVAKVGNFEWAQQVTTETEESDNSTEPKEMEPLPDHFYPWLAPETFLKKEYVFPSDIWALGVLFWEVYTLGKAPYDGLDMEAQQQVVMDGVRPSKPALAHFTLYRVMKSCWRHDVEDRSTPENLLQQLIDIQSRYADVEKVVVHI